MAKGNTKSSASSGTRKKHARKAATNPDLPGDPPKVKSQPKGKSKKEKKEAKNAPKVKSYIPPVKPGPAVLDPLDTMGLARMLPAELVVCLRMLGKKSSVTRERGLEELKKNWLDKEEEMVQMCPVWLHHLPALLTHSQRRIRFLSATIHSTLLDSESVRENLLTLAYDDSDVIATWALSANDIDRSVSQISSTSWKHTSEIDASSLVDFIGRTILDPSGVCTTLNPPPPQAPPPPAHSKSARKGHTPVYQPPTPEPSSKEEDELESTSDRDTRLRISAFGALKWCLQQSDKAYPVNDLLSSPQLYTALYVSERPPWIDGDAAFGAGQPALRKSAWNMIGSVAQKADLEEGTVQLIATSVLDSAFSEIDQTVQSVLWGNLLVWLKAHPESWALESKFNYPNAADEDDEDEESDDEGSGDEDADAGPSKPTQPASANNGKAYHLFLRYLSEACNNAPTIGYPAIVVLFGVGGLSSDFLSSATPGDQRPIDFLLDAFWKATESSTLTAGLAVLRANAQEAFLSSFTECLLLLLRRILRGPAEDASKLLSPAEPSDVETEGSLVPELVQTQFWKILDYVLSLPPTRIDALLGIVRKTFVQLEELDADLSNNVVFPLAQESLSAFIDPQNEDIRLRLLVAFSLGEDTLATKTRDQILVSKVLRRVLDSLDKDEEKKRLGLLMRLYKEKGGKSLWEFVDDQQVKDELDKAIIQAQTQTFLLPAYKDIFEGLLLSHPSEERRRELWTLALGGLTTTQDNADALDRAEHLLSFVESHQQDSFHGSEIGAGIDDVWLKWTGEVLGRSDAQGKELALLRRVLKGAVKGYFISPSGFSKILENVEVTFVSRVQDTLHVSSSASPSTLDAMLSLIEAVSVGSSDLTSSFVEHISPGIYLLSTLSLEGDSAKERKDRARRVWDALPEDTLSIRQVRVKDWLKGILEDVNVRLSSNDVLGVARTLSPLNLMVDILPSKEHLDILLLALPQTPQDPSLGVLDPLIPPPSAYEDVPSPSAQADDASGLSSYPRVLIALIDSLFDDRTLAKRNLWAIRHILAFEGYTKDYLALPSASLVFSRSSEKSRDLRVLLGEALKKGESVVAYLLATSNLDVQNVVKAVMRGGVVSDAQGLEGLIVEILKRAKEEDGYVESRILRGILSHLLEGATREEAGLWFEIARFVEKDAPTLCSTILWCITRYAPEPLKLDRYRTELASSLLGVKPSQANTSGLTTLRKLSAVAPRDDSDVLFMTQQRAVNAVKAFQGWISADDGEVDEEVEGEMTRLLTGLIPILQGVPGSHWDMVWDLLESNLENVDFSDGSSLTILSRTLHLVLTVQDLASTNKSLRNDWQDRSVGVLTTIRDLATVKFDTNEVSLPKSVNRELLLSIVQDLPSTLIAKDTLPKMSHLLMDSSLEVQKMSYQLLQTAARKHTEDLVIEAGVDTEDIVKIELPVELLDLLQRTIDEDLENEGRHVVIGWLLAWLVAFEAFEEASLKVRMGYIAQFRSLGLVEGFFLPNIWHLLQLDLGIGKAFRLDPWQVDEFYVQLLDLDEPFAIPVLSAHLYYRSLLAVRSLIHSWVLECKDRQLSTAIGTYTSQHFSPVIITAELSHLKNPDILAEITDENMSVKVAQVINEVTASYSVDEHQLEIKVKIPTDWPLHRIEVKDSKHAGVQENRWRAWVFNVQQIIWSQNGRIADGLSLFKKNVAGHFEGQVECAICYSIISVMDGQLPRKPCKTCKNRFHSSCLYKWFNTSHSSSCPLCRSDIF